MCSARGCRNLYMCKVNAPFKGQLGWFMGSEEVTGHELVEFLETRTLFFGVISCKISGITYQFQGRTVSAPLLRHSRVL